MLKCGSPNTAFVVVSVVVVIISVVVLISAMDCSVVTDSIVGGSVGGQLKFSCVRERYRYGNR